MLGVGKKYSIDVTDLRMLVLRVITLSVKFVSRDELWTSQFADGFVDWKLVKQLTNKNVLGGCGEWLGMLEICHWDDLVKSESEIATAYLPLAMLRRNMKECSLDTGDSEAWTPVCRALLLLLVQGLPCLSALEMLTCAQFKRNTRTGCVELLAKQVHSLTCSDTPSVQRTTDLEGEGREGAVGGASLHT